VKDEDVANGAVHGRGYADLCAEIDDAAGQPAQLQRLAVLACLRAA
jgi:hypothetical protein